MIRFIALLVAWGLFLAPFQANVAYAQDYKPEYPDLVVFSVTATFTTGILYTSDGQILTPLHVVGHHTNFTISSNCRLVLSTFSDDRNGVFMQITDREGSQFSTLQTATTFFQNPEIEEFQHPAFAPDNQGYAVIAKTEDRKILYVSNGTSSAEKIYSWDDDFLVANIKWQDMNNVIVKVAGPEFDEIAYWLFDIAAGPDENGEYLPHSVSYDEYEALPTETKFWEPTMLPRVAKALACEAFKG